MYLRRSAVAGSKPAGRRGLPYERDGDARRKSKIKPLKEAMLKQTTK